MDIGDLKKQLENQEVGYQNYFKYPKPLTPKQIDSLLDQFGVTEEISSDWNGCDLDFSGTFEYEGNEIEYWGSAYEGSLLFQKN